MDELHEKLNRVFTILKFILSGPFILSLSIFVDTINFFMNLFYEPVLTIYKENKG
jgi:pilus assembly protein TadC